MKLHGIALKPHVESTGQTLKTKVYTEEALRESAESLDGKPVTVGFDQKKVIGTVTDAEYVDGEGIRYEAEIEDTDTFDIDHDIAPRLYHDAVDDGDEQPIEVENIEFDLLGVVPEKADGVGEYERIQEYIFK